jgi:CubicO group peptidase (beta-lactamase class C family)
MKKIFLLAGLFSAVLGFSQNLNSAAIDTLVQKAMASFRVPGIAVAVVKDGKLVHSKGYGVRSLKSMLPVTPETLFGIASNSKAITAAAIGILVEQGKIKWEDHVRNYIPEFKLYDSYVTEHFTIKDLLTHRSGMGLGAGDLMFFPDSSDFTLKDIIYNLRFLPQVSEFRTQYDYDNNLYIVAGEVIARVSGQSWEEFVEKNIFLPLGMKTSAPSFERISNFQNIIEAHAPVNGEIRVIPRNTLRIGHAAGGVYANINDLSQWVICLMNKGVSAGGKRILAESTVKEMWTPQTIIPVSNPVAYNVHFSSYGLGFFLSDVKGKFQACHTGGLEGMVTQITVIPEINLGIIVLTNQQEGAAFTAITNSIKDVYLGVSGIDWHNLLLSNRKRGWEEAKKITDSVEKDVLRAIQQSKQNWKPYLGTNSDSWMGEVYILEKNGLPWLQIKKLPKTNGSIVSIQGHDDGSKVERQKHGC